MATHIAHAKNSTESKEQHGTSRHGHDRSSNQRFHRGRIRRHRSMETERAFEECDFPDDRHLVLRCLTQHLGLLLRLALRFFLLNAALLRDAVVEPCVASHNRKTVSTSQPKHTNRINRALPATSVTQRTSSKKSSSTEVHYCGRKCRHARRRLGLLRRSLLLGRHARSDHLVKIWFSLNPQSTNISE